jgi:hypothetical protein
MVAVDRVPPPLSLLLPNALSRNQIIKNAEPVKRSQNHTVPKIRKSMLFVLG